ncbi:MAG: THxN family PEP-CTERM protein [Pacificimonas sp.]
MFLRLLRKFDPPPLSSEVTWGKTMKTFSKRSGAICAAALMGASLFATSAAAAPVIQWSYNITAEWDASQTFFSGGSGQTFVNESEISWGANGGNYDGPDGDRSALVITNSPASGLILTNVEDKAANSFEHFNNVISANFKQLETTVLGIDIALDPTNPDGAALPIEMFHFDIAFNETVNTGSNGECADGTPVSDGPCMDIFVVLGENADGYDFEYDGQSYRLNFFTADGAFGPLSDEACLNTGAEIGCVGFRTMEDAITAVDFQFNIENRGSLIPVPAPGALGLLGLGLLGIGAARRRK